MLNDSTAHQQLPTEHLHLYIHRFPNPRKATKPQNNRDSVITPYSSNLLPQSFLKIRVLRYVILSHLREYIKRG